MIGVKEVIGVIGVKEVMIVDKVIVVDQDQVIVVDQDRVMIVVRVVVVDYQID